MQERVVPESAKMRTPASLGCSLEIGLAFHPVFFFWDRQEFIDFANVRRVLYLGFCHQKALSFCATLLRSNLRVNQSNDR